MLRRLLYKEILEHFMSLRFAIACCLCLGVILCSLLVRIKDYKQAMGDYYEESATAAHRLDRYAPWSVAFPGPKIVRMPNAMKVFVRGVEDIGCQAVQVPLEEPLRFLSAKRQSPSAGLFLSMDLVTFVGLIMSLLALVFGYDAVCGEKERGTLRLMLSYSLPRHGVLIAKWIGGYVCLILPFLLTTLAAATVVLVTQQVTMTSEQWLRLLAIIGLSLVYLAAMYSLALFVSTLTHRAATSILLLLCVWVVFILAWPNLSPRLARQLQPAANVQEKEGARAAALRPIRAQADAKIKANREALKVPDEWWKYIPLNDWSKLQYVHQMYVFDTCCLRDSSAQSLIVEQKIRQRFHRELQAQIELSGWIGRISPFFSFASAATELADAGVLDQDRYREQLYAYQAIWSPYIADELVAWEQKGLEMQEHYPEWATHRVKPIPAFAYVPPAAHDYFKAVAADAGLLAGLCVLFFMLSYAKFLRYDVR